MPSFNFDATAIVPLWSSTIFLTIAKPKPVPVSLVEKYGSKILSTFSGAMPPPVSWILMQTKFLPSGFSKSDGARASVESVMVRFPPVFIAWTAFKSKLLNTERRYSGSPAAGGIVSRSTIDI